MNGILQCLRRTGASVWHGIHYQIPVLLRIVYAFFAQRTQREWSLAVGALLYYVAVRWIHHALDAGPIVLIITALVGIFTIGLGENTDGISAYSVFNRGFQRLLGEVDAEDLVAQQMGGGMRINRGGAGGGERAILDPPPPPPPPQARAARPVPDENNNDMNSSSDDDEDDNNDANDGGGGGDNNNNNNRPKARLSGKKARRRNLERRRELRRQRDAALALGFGADEHAEALAMQRLLDEQMAENQ